MAGTPQPFSLSRSERVALLRAQRDAALGSHPWRRIQILLQLDRTPDSKTVARALRCQRRLVNNTVRRYLAGGRTPAALVLGKAGRPVGRSREVIPLLHRIRASSVRVLKVQEYRDLLASRYGIELSEWSVRRYLRLARQSDPLAMPYDEV